MNAQPADTIKQDASECYEWHAHPAAQNHPKLCMAIIIILTIACLIYITSEIFLWSMFAVILLTMALQRFFFPSRFQIDAKGITAKYLLGKKRFDWKFIRRFNYDANGGYLSTRKLPTRLDAYRGMHLYFSSDRKEIIERINSMIEIAEA